QSVSSGQMTGTWNNAAKPPPAGNSVPYEDPPFVGQAIACRGEAGGPHTWRPDAARNSVPHEDSPFVGQAIACRGEPKDHTPPPPFGTQIACPTHSTSPPRPPRPLRWAWRGRYTGHASSPAGSQGRSGRWGSASRPSARPACRGRVGRA